MRFGSVLLASIALTSAARARDIVAGQVLAPGGAGLSGCNLDFFDSATGDEETNVQNDATGAGGFFLVTVPPGTYDIRVWPPSGIPILPGEAPDVSIAGFVNVGTVQLSAGVFLSGTVTGTAGLPAAGVDVDVEDSASGTPIPLAGDDTNALGQFQVVVPATTLDVFFDPSNVSGSTLAPSQRLDVSVCVDTNLGAIPLQPGFVLSLFVFANGLPVPSADIDVRPAGGGTKLRTPGDNTDNTGFVDVAVPAGTYEVEVDPPLALKRVAQVVPGVSVSGNTSLGTVSLASGWYLSGTVTDPTGQPLAGVDVDVEDPATAIEVPTPADDTDALGQYTVVVPPGTWRVELDPAPFVPLAGASFPGVAVFADTTLDATLASSPCTPPLPYGTGTAGTGGGVPTLATNHFARIGSSSFRVTLGHARGGAFGVLGLGLAPANVPLFGGTLLVYPAPLYLFNVVLSGPAGVACVGSGSSVFPIPLSGALVGAAVFFQGAVLDPAAVQGIALTDGLGVVVCP